MSLTVPFLSLSPLLPSPKFQGGGRSGNSFGGDSSGFGNDTGRFGSGFADSNSGGFGSTANADDESWD